MGEQYHFGFRFGIACAIVDVVPDISNKEVAFQKGFKGGFAAAPGCMELRVCSRLGIKEFTKPKDRTRRFKHEPKIEGRTFYNRIEEGTPKIGTGSKARRAP